MTGLILMAAGASSRMGRSKLELQIEETTLLEHAVRQSFQSAVNTITIVSGAFALPTSLEKVYSPKVQIINNTRWSTGIGSSIKAGLESQIKRTPDAEAVIFIVADQPFLSAAHVNRLIENFNATDRIIASSYSDTIGVPALFPKRYFEAIGNLPDNAGAKSLFIKHQEDLITLPFDKGEIDLDTPENYQRFIDSLKK
jgi:molybdenum cofactor cytidylyltransferase